MGKSSGSVPCACDGPTAVKDSRSTLRWKIPGLPQPDAVCPQTTLPASLLSRLPTVKKLPRPPPPQRTGTPAAAPPARPWSPRLGKRDPPDRSHDKGGCLLINLSLRPSRTHIMSAVPLSGMTRAPCVPCSTSDLDLTTMPPIQSAIVDDYTIRTGPKSTPDGEGPLEFELISSGDDWLDLSECYLNIQWKIRKGDGTNLTYFETNGDQAAGITCQPVNLALHSMFRQVDLIMNEKLIYSLGENYPYRAYLTTISNYSNPAKKTWLRQFEGFYWDDAGEMDADTNQAFVYKAKEMWGSNGGKSTYLRGKLHLDLVHQGRLIPNNVNVRLILTRSRQEFFMMSFVANQSPFEITIESATLEARRVKTGPFWTIASGKGVVVLQWRPLSNHSRGGEKFHFEQRWNRIHVCRAIAQQNIPVHGYQRGILWQI